MHLFSWFTRTRDPKENLWHNCTSCSNMTYINEIEDNLWVCPLCGHHERISASMRLKITFDDSKFEKLDLNLKNDDPLNFPNYKEKLNQVRKKLGTKECFEAGIGNIHGVKAVVLAVDFKFIGGSMGRAFGNAMMDCSTYCIKHKLPFIVFSSSGGARMQEGMYSLYQMPRTVLAVDLVKEARITFISVLCDPTTGGVEASYALLGTVSLAENKALIGFAGPRVIQQTIRAELPEGFQSAEFQLKNGFLDRIVHRKDMRKNLGDILGILG